MCENEAPRRNVRQVLDEAAGGNNAPPMPQIREEEADVPIILPLDLLPIVGLDIASDDEEEEDNQQNQQNQPIVNGGGDQDNAEDENGGGGGDEADVEVAQLNRNQFPQEILQDLRLGAVNNVFIGNDGVQERPFNLNQRRGAVPFIFYQRQNSNEDNDDNRN